MTVKLHEGQLEVAKDTHRFRVICAGRRWGKSVLSQLIVLQWATKEAGTYWIVSPTYRQGKQIHWRGLQQIVPREWIAKKNEVELSITLKNGSVIELKGAENPDALRGVKLRGLVVDEIASIRNWSWLWDEVLRATLTDYEAPAIFISTPQGFNHFHELYQLGQTDETSYKSWKFTSYDNPYIPTQEIDEAKKELTEDTFAQEYMADFRKFTGLVHKPWDREIHLIDSFDIPLHWQYVRGFDYGSTHYTASVRGAVNSDDIMFIDSSYLDNHRSIEEHSKVIQADDFNKGVVPVWADPSGAQWQMEFQLRGLSIQQATRETGQAGKSWVELCVEKVNERLRPVQGHTVYLPTGEVIENAPKLFILNNPSNQPLIKQIENLKWRTQIKGGNSIVSVLDESDDPVQGGHYDLMAALRYLMVSYLPSNAKEAGSVIQSNKKKRSKWAIG